MKFIVSMISPCSGHTTGKDFSGLKVKKRHEGEQEQVALKDGTGTM